MKGYLIGLTKNLCVVLYVLCASLFLLVATLFAFMEELFSDWQFRKEYRYWRAHWIACIYHPVKKHWTKLSVKNRSRSERNERCC